MNIKIRLLSLLIFLMASIVCLAQKASPSHPSELVKQIDQYVNVVQERYGMPGIALAIVKDGEIIHKKNYGHASIEHNVPITDKSIFRVYSLTKPIITTGLFQLIEQNKLSLEDEIAKYLKDLPEAWRSIKIKHLLTHSSGLPDIKKYEVSPEEIAKEKVYQDPIEFQAGDRYKYNQSNYWLVQRIIESLAHQSVEEYILQHQFDKQSKERDVFFSSDSKDIEMNRVTAYFPFSKGRMQIDLPSRERYLISCNGLNISLDQFLSWDKRFNKDELLKKESKSQMWELFPYNQSTKKFVYGWDQRTLNGHVSYGFSGSLITAYRIFPQDNLSIIFLANGLERFFNIENIINHLASIVDEDIVDINNYVFESLYPSFLKDDMKGLKKTLASLKNTEAYSKANFEQQINNLGYMLLNANNNAKAIEIFTFNSKEYPTSWNTFDSLGEALEKNGNFTHALKNYKKALELNTQNALDHNPELRRRIQVLEKMGRGE